MAGAVSNSNAGDVVFEKLLPARLGMVAAESLLSFSNPNDVQVFGQSFPHRLKPLNHSVGKRFMVGLHKTRDQKRPSPPPLFG